MRLPVLIRLLALLPVVGVAACGGGGDGPSQATLTFAPSTDLTLFSDGSAQAAGTLRVGDTAANLSVRAALRFGIYLFIPSGSTILSAKLRLQQVSVQGNPYGVLGNAVVDRVDYGLTLDAGDFSPIVLTPNLGSISNTATLELKELDVTAAVAADVAAGDLTSDFLVRFTSATAANATADLAAFEDSENSAASGVTAKLVVTYQ